ncbi:MAG: hypothetical protein IT355_17115 [Gemmatimonadaceae bacterium]|nr:hypothetical protein [Gemmatimonadaceae bacterium]
MTVTTRTTGALCTAAFGLLLATPALAQKDPGVRLDERWRPFVGCWSTHTGGLAGPGVCILGTEDPQVVELRSIGADSVVTSLLIDASGRQVTRTRDGCTGWERGTWSRDERRLFVQSELTCGGGPVQKTSSLYAMSHNAGFARIEAVKTRGGSGVRVINFASVAPGADVPQAMLDRMPPATELRTYAARVEAAAPVTAADVAEAVKQVDSPVVEAWIADRGQRFDLAATDLRRLRDAGVAPGVIDVMVALSNPQVFTLARGGSPAVRTATADPRVVAGGQVPWGYDPMLGSPYVGGGTYGYGYGYGYGYAGGLYGNWLNPYAACISVFSCQNSGWAYGGGGPVVIITQPTPTGPAPRPGRVVNGAGYSQGGASNDGRRATPSGGGGGTSTSVGSGSGSSSSGGSSTSGGGAQRTAKPRP